MTLNKHKRETAYDEGRHAEREAIVAWLREYAAPGQGDEDTLVLSAPSARTVRLLADAVEQGRHLCNPQKKE